MTALRADAVVVGTGAGGAAAAAELAAGGLDVVVLEEGARHDYRTFTARPRDMTLRLYRDAGQLATIGTPPIVLPLGRAAGGTTLINSGTCFRTPAHVLERWALEDGVRGLYVADGSVVPSSPQVNPQVTIMALAVRLGRALAGVREGAFARMGG